MRNDGMSENVPINQALIADTFPATEPPKRVWQNIELRLFKPNTSNTIGWWRSLAIFSTSALLFLTFLTVSQEVLKPQATATSTVAVMADEESRSAFLLVLRRNAEGREELRVTPLAALQEAPGKSFELWLLPSDNSNPVSLGLMPKQGEASMPVSSHVGKLLLSGGLAVSLEPEGGSPTGQPTGAVLYQGKLKQL